jgi:hypothetical protein
MGMNDEVYCYAVLPDGRDPRGTCFQTKSFPDAGSRLVRGSTDSAMQRAIRTDREMTTSNRIPVLTPQGHLMLARIAAFQCMGQRLVDLNNEFRGPRGHADFRQIHPRPYNAERGNQRLLSQLVPWRCVEVVNGHDSARRRPLCQL